MLVEGVVASMQVRFLRDSLRLIEERDAREAAKLRALEAAAAVGFADLDHGRYRDIAADNIGEAIELLSRRTGEKVSRANR